MIRKVSLLKLKDFLLLPNLITISRLIVSIYLFLYYSIFDFSTAVLVTLIALIGISDSIDGIVARKLNQVSKLGTILDPVCDRTVFILLLFWFYKRKEINKQELIRYSIISLIPIILSQSGTGVFLTIFLFYYSVLLDLFYLFIKILLKLIPNLQNF